ncbi:hypothetical protein TNCV_882511 [Trichonephila clavipes]|nr:hypothetical protein TNCV_882511 [Trichonephila clavipes]
MRIGYNTDSADIVELMADILTVVVTSNQINLTFKNHEIGLGSNPEEAMDVCKCIVLLWYGDILSSCRVASPLVRLVEGEERYGTLTSLRRINWYRVHEKCGAHLSSRLLPHSLRHPESAVKTSNLDRQFQPP